MSDYFTPCGCKSVFRYIFQIPSYTKIYIDQVEFPICWNCFRPIDCKINISLLICSNNEGPYMSICIFRSDVTTIKTAMVFPTRIIKSKRNILANNRGFVSVKFIQTLRSGSSNSECIPIVLRGTDRSCNRAFP